MDGEAGTRGGRHEIRKMTVDDCPTVARAQARAFFDDPLQVWALPDASTRLSILEQVFALLSRYSSVPRGESYTDDVAVVRGVLGPARPVRLLDREAALAMAPILDLLGDADARFRAAEDTMRAGPPDRAALLPAGPRHRPAPPGGGARLGGDAAGARRVATPSGIPAYLESTKERNVGFYESHGFAVTGRERIGLGGPPLWLMWRAPKE